MMGPSGFTIGGVLRRAAFILDRHGAPLAAAAALLVALPELLTGSVGSTVATTTRSGADAGADAGVGMSWALSASSGTGLLAFLAQLLLLGFVISTAFADMRGEPPNPGAALRAAVSLYLPILGVTLLTSLGLMLGYLLFVVPGIMLHCAWAVAVPALVAEPAGVMAALGRSRRLTAGHRWPIFGLALLYGIAVLFAFGLGFGLLLAGLGTGGPGSIVTMLLRPILSAAIVLAGYVGVTALYIELRLAEAGGAPA